MHPSTLPSFPGLPPRHWLRQFALWTVGLVGSTAILAAVLAWCCVARPPSWHEENLSLAWFADMTEEAGVDFTHDAGDLSQYQLPQIHGSGAALLDCDGDGRPDLYLLNAGGPGSASTCRLYRNVSAAGVLRLEDVTVGSGLGVAGHCTGVIAGDVDNDGRPDLVVAQYGGVRLFLNRGNGRFEDATEPSGLRNPLWATSLNLLDFDRDGRLDLVVVNYLDNDPTQVCRDPTSSREYCGPVIFTGLVTKLFRNLGEKEAGGVRFEDVTVKAGLTKPAPGLGVYCTDFDGDGWPDIFIANDGRPNHLWINQKDGTFKEEAYPRGIALDSLGRAQAGMGVAVGDVDGDGLFDVYVAHLITERNTLWAQGPGRGQFTDRTGPAGLLGTAWHGTGFGALMGDFDQDGWPDLALVNGGVFRIGNATPNPDVGEHLMHYTERNQLLRNEGQGRFRDVSAANGPFCGTPNVARGLAAGDLDGDGALDLVQTTVAGRARVYRNVARGRGHWLLVRAVDPRLGGREAYGAEVVVEAGGRRLLRLLNPGDSYQSSSDPRLHFGLGGAARYDAVHVRWPDGLTEAFPGGDADRPLLLRRGHGTEEHRNGS